MVKLSIEFALCFLVFLFASTAQAVIVSIGNVDPDDPSSWGESTDAYIGKTSDGIITIEGQSSVISHHGYLGYEPGVTGQAAVTGAGSVWELYDPSPLPEASLYVGYEGDGSLNITDGGVVNCGLGYVGRGVDSTGVVTVDGVDSLWSNNDSVTIGVGGNGTLNVTGGGQVYSKWSSYIGSGSGSLGTVNVSGAGSTWQGGSLTVGKNGTGVLNVTDGGSVTLGLCQVGYYSNEANSVTVSGAGSKLDAGNIKLGTWGSSELNIADGGVVNVNGSTELVTGVTSSGASAIHLNNGTLNTGTLSAGSSQLTGTGTINTKSLVADGIDLIFDAAHGPQQTFTLNGPEQNITLNLDYEDSYSLGAGYTGTGTLTVRDGVVVESGTGYIGEKPGSNGTVTVSGAGSTWNNSYLYVGLEGSGTLNVTDGGTVNANWVTRVGDWPGSSGQIHFDNGTLTSQSLFVSASQLTGTGTINTNGLYACGFDLVFDATHGPQQTIRLKDQDRDITINLDLEDSWLLGAGYTGNGSLTIADGVTVYAFEGIIGYHPDSFGTATVSGVGSTWKNYSFIVGGLGTGELSIVNGGTVDSDSASIAGGIGSTGKVTVSGVGSTWLTDDLAVGNLGYGELNIIDGGVVNSSRNCEIGDEEGGFGKVTVSGAGSTWTCDWGIDIGSAGDGEMNIIGGGVVHSSWSSDIGRTEGATGTVNVSGVGSIWTCDSRIEVGSRGVGEMNITGGGLVVSDSITLHEDDDGNETGFINLSTGGMLAIKNSMLVFPFAIDTSLEVETVYLEDLGFPGDEEQGTSLEYFLGLVDGTDAIRWWDNSLGDDGDWALLTTATPGEDYTIERITEGDLAGYMLLTVGSVPEPSSVVLMLTALLAGGCLFRAKR